MTPLHPRLSVIVPCRNEARSIRATVESILNLAIPPGGFEVIIADGQSDDGTRDILSDLVAQNPARLRVIDNPGRSVSCGLNMAIRAAEGDLIVRMDAHTTYAQDYLIACVATMERTQAANVGGPWKARGTGTVGRAIAASFHSRLSTGGGGAHNLSYEGPVDTVYLGCWRREVLAQVGYFDETLVRNQDDELNLRIVRSGNTVWQSPSIRCEYECRRSLATLWRQYYQYGYWKVRVIQKHSLPASWRHLAPVVALSIVTALTALSPLSRWTALGSAILWTLYIVMVTLESVRLAKTHGWELLVPIAATFPCYHFGYAVGFLQGLLDFSVTHRGPRTAAVSLSR